MARPSKLTDDLRDRLALLVRAGNTVEVAAAACGISERTFYAWMEKGEAARAGRYHDFYEAVERARADAEASHVVRLARAAQNGSWRAAAWLLERRYPERWAPLAERRHLAEREAGSDDPFDALDELTPRRLAREQRPT